MLSETRRIIIIHQEEIRENVLDVLRVGLSMGTLTKWWISNRSTCIFRKKKISFFQTKLTYTPGKRKTKMNLIAKKLRHKESKYRVLWAKKEKHRKKPKKVAKKLCLVLIKMTTAHISECLNLVSCTYNKIV